MSSLPNGGGPDEPPDGLLGQLPPGTVPPAETAARQARDREIRMLLETSVRKLQERP
jgi:hypothetical protein